MRLIEVELADDAAGLPQTKSEASPKGLQQPEPEWVAPLDVWGDLPEPPAGGQRPLSGSAAPASDRSGGRAVDSGIVSGPLFFPENELLYLSGRGLG